MAPMCEGLFIRVSLPPEVTKEIIPRVPIEMPIIWIQCAFVLNATNATSTVNIGVKLFKIPQKPLLNTVPAYVKRNEGMRFPQSPTIRKYGALLVLNKPKD